MTYEYAGPSYSDVTNSNAPLLDPDPSSDSSVVANIKEWIAGGASPSKIVLGMFKLKTTLSPFLIPADSDQEIII